MGYPNRRGDQMLAPSHPAPPDGGEARRAGESPCMDFAVLASPRSSVGARGQEDVAKVGRIVTRSDKEDVRGTPSLSREGRFQLSEAWSVGNDLAVVDGDELPRRIRLVDSGPKSPVSYLVNPPLLGQRLHAVEYPF